MKKPNEIHKRSGVNMLQDKSKHINHSATIYSIIFIVIVGLANSNLAASSLDPLSSLSRVSLPISSKGIVVPKRPAIIAGLEHSFRGRKTTTATKDSLNATIQTQQESTQATPPLSLFSSITGSRNQQQQQQQLQANKRPTAASVNGQQQHALYLDRRQQEILAANPNYSTQLLNQRSDVAGGGQISSSSSSDPVVQRLLAQQSQLNNAAIGGGNNNATVVSDLATSNRDQQREHQQQQQYRGYSLIEIEVRCEQDRRFVQDLYANLSAALNEQANKPQSITVSPYADIDFWSFKNGVNDQIDIMLSPKSRQFILNQLTRAKIKHRVKIDDIQARLEQQTGLNNQSNDLLQQQQQQLQQQQQQQLSGRQLPNYDQQDQQQVNKQNKLNGRQDITSTGTGTTTSSISTSGSLTPSSSQMNDSLFFENYQRLSEINQYLESLVGRARDVARVQVIGRSSQGRYLRVLRLGYDQVGTDGSTADDGYSPLLSDRNNPSSGSTNQQQQPPVNQNGSRILEQFLRRQQSVRKLGSIWLDGGTHAREWISPATVLYMAFRLTDNHVRCQRFFDYLRQAVQQNGLSNELESRSSNGAASSSDPQVDDDLILGINEINSSLLSTSNTQAKRLRPRSELEQKLEILAKRPQEVASEHSCDLEMEQLLRRYTFFMEPVLNPDGYEYSHTHNRLWRKTRSTSNHPIYRHFCLGADPNRNYDARHGSTGSSSHPCSQTYGGTTPFTEPETRHQSNFVYAHRSNMKMYISFHSYSQMILLPYSHSKQLAPDHKDLESVGQAAVKAIERTHGTQYRVGPSASILYTASGTASDWAYEKAGVKYAYTIELRDTGAFGFLLPKQQIIPTGEETFNGLLAMIAQMEKNDNLLMSKSSPILNTNMHDPSVGSMGPVNATGINLHQQSMMASGGDLIHTPDMDQLRPFGRFRPKPAQLENALDGSETWATPEPRPPGVRDRKPMPNSADEALQANRIDEEAYSRSHPLQDETVAINENEPDAGMTFEGEGELMEPTEFGAASRMADEARMGRRNGAISESLRLSQRGTANSHRSSILDSSVSVATALKASEQVQLHARSTAMVAEQLRRLKSDQQALGLSSNGRSLIKNVPQGSRTQEQSHKRESSEHVRAGILRA